MRAANKILVTGGAGYLGSLLVPRLLQAGYHVKVLDCLYFTAQPLAPVLNHPRLALIQDDMLNHENHRDLFDGVDTVIHLASISNDPSSDLDPNLTVRVNHFATMSLARRAKLNAVRQFIFMSSCAVYGGEGDRLLNETSATGPLSLYALTKLEGERGLMELHTKDFGVVIFRLATLFGLSPRMRFDLAVNVMVKRAMQGNDLLVFGAGQQFRPFLHVADAAEAIVNVATRKDSAAVGKIFNVGRDDLNFKITDLATKLHGKFPLVAIKNAPESTDQRSYNVSFRKLAEELHILPSRDIDFAVEELKQAFAAGSFPSPDDASFYNLLQLKQVIATNPAFYSPASTPNWTDSLPAAASKKIVPLRKKKVVAVVLAYNNAALIETAFKRIPLHLVDDIIVMDDCSKDDTSGAARRLGLKVYRNERNMGYGGNLKNGLKKALELGADYVVEVHGDGAQFNPIAIQDALPHMQANVRLILGSRFQNKWLALANGMSFIRFFANISLSFFDRLVLKLPLTEFHTGFRIYSKELLANVPYESNANSYLFSFQIIAQAAYYQQSVAEVPVEADYHAAHTSHSLRGASAYAINTFFQLGSYLLARAGLVYNQVFRQAYAAERHVDVVTDAEATSSSASDRSSTERIGA